MPTSDWVIRTIPGKGKSGLGYCSMNNSYQSGQKLIFARDASNSSTIAIDFQKSILEVGRQYVVFVKTGQTSKQYTAIAATTNIMIMKVGTDNEVYDGFVQNKEVSFRIGADTLYFGFSDSIIDALNALTDCSAALASNKSFEGKKIAMPTAGLPGGDAVNTLEGKKTPPGKDFQQQVTENIGAEGTQQQTVPQAFPVSKELSSRSEVAEMSSILIQNKKFKKIKVKKVPVEKLEAPREDMVTTTITNENPEGVDKVEKATPKKRFKPAGVKDDSVVIQEEQQEQVEEISIEEKSSAQKEADVRAQQLREEETSKLESTIAKLKMQNKKLMQANKIIKNELTSQKINSDNSQKIVDKTKEELLKEIRGFKKEQGHLALQDAKLQKESQEILLETQDRQKEILAEIKRLKAENEKLKNSTSEEQKDSKKLIAKNQSEMEILREENRKLALQNELEDQTRQKKELESSLEQNRIRSELLKLKAENTQLSMDLESGKTDVMSETGLMKQQNMALAQETKSELESNKNMTAVTFDNQQKLIKETEKLKEENERLRELTEREKAETLKLAEESQAKQGEIEVEISRIKQHNQEMLEKIKSVKERSIAVEAANRERTAPISLVSKKEETVAPTPAPKEVPAPVVEEDFLKKWLYNSGAAGSSYIEVDKKAKKGEKIYRWKDSDVYGYAQAVQNINSADINKVVSDYIKHLSTNCKGDFAKTSGDVQMVSSYEVLEAETACMGKKRDTAAVVLFVLGNNKINIITQETAPGNIEVALENRKKIISSID